MNMRMMMLHALVAAMAVVAVVAQSQSSVQPTTEPPAQSPVPSPRPASPSPNPPPQESPTPSPKTSPVVSPRPPPSPSPQPSPRPGQPTFSSGTSSVVDAIDCVAPGMLAMTFDDGPSGYTLPLLDTLRALNVTVTFFVLGYNTQGNPGIVKRAFDEGHQIASHTFDHPHLPTLSDAAVADQLTRNENLLQGITGVRPAIMRPPYGESTSATINVIRRLGYTAVNWNIDTKDFEGVDPYLGFNQYLQAGGRDGYITLQHDIQQHSVTPAKITQLVNLARSRGFRFVTISECVGRQPYKEGWGNVRPGAGVNAAVTTTSLIPNTTLSPLAYYSPTVLAVTTAASPTPSPTSAASVAKPFVLGFALLLAAALFAA